MLLFSSAADVVRTFPLSSLLDSEKAAFPSILLEKSYVLEPSSARQSFRPFSKKQFSTHLPKPSLFTLVRNISAAHPLPTNSSLRGYSGFVRKL